MPPLTVRRRFRKIHGTSRILFARRYRVQSCFCFFFYNITNGHSGEVSTRDVSRAADMYRMLFCVTSFNKDISIGTCPVLPVRERCSNEPRPLQTDAIQYCSSLACRHCSSGRVCSRAISIKTLTKYINLCDHLTSQLYLNTFDVPVPVNLLRVLLNDNNDVFIPYI